MYATKLISVRCGGCGQVYHVPPPEADQRAKCRPCGHEFLIPSSPQERVKSDRECNAPRHAAADRIAAAQMVADFSTQHRRRIWRARRRYAAAVCGVISVLLAAIAFSSFSAPATERAAAEQMHRGRVAKLSAPHSKFEVRRSPSLSKPLSLLSFKLKRVLVLAAGSFWMNRGSS
jgi:hypothetical protein